MKFQITFFLLILLSTTTLNANPHNLVKKLCPHASYPDICLRTLSSSSSAATTPRQLALVAVSVSLAHVKSATDFLTGLRSRGREQGALSDCVEQMGDSVEELSKTLAALRRLRRDGDFQWQMSNAQTWVSAALTNEDTCLDGFKEINGKVRSDVRERITNVARVTSNALYLINAIDNKS